MKSHPIELTLTPAYFTVSKVFSEMLDLHHTLFWLVWQQNISYTASLLNHLPLLDHLKQQQLCIYFLFVLLFTVCNLNNDILTRRVKSRILSFYFKHSHYSREHNWNNQFNGNCILIMPSATLGLNKTTWFSNLEEHFEQSLIMNYDF